VTATDRLNIENEINDAFGPWLIQPPEPTAQQLECMAIKEYAIEMARFSDIHKFTQATTPGGDTILAMYDPNSTKVGIRSDLSGEARSERMFHEATHAYLGYGSGCTESCVEQKMLTCKGMMWYAPLLADQPASAEHPMPNRPSIERWLLASGIRFANMVKTRQARSCSLEYAEAVGWVGNLALTSERGWTYAFHAACHGCAGAGSVIC
jgi:hypothetical protein